MAAVKDIDRGWNNIVRELEKAKGMEVAVGILEGSQNEGQSIAEYATYNEFGTDNVPSRPFMATSFDENVAEINSDFKRQADAMVQGKRTANEALTVIGQKHAGRIQTTITGRNFLPRLAPSTIAAKKGSTKTLVDTGAMANAVHISIRGRRP
jgi:hypothetical protein